MSEDSSIKIIEDSRFRAKQRILRALKEAPIIEQACSKAGIPRSTYYRWVNEDYDFRKNVLQAQETGYLAINDVAESKLIEKVAGGELRAVTYWLETNHRRYIRSLKHKLVNPPEHEGPSDEELDRMIREALDGHDNTDE